MKNKYNEMYNSESVSSERESRSPRRFQDAPIEAKDSNDDLFSVEYKGDWKATQKVNFRSEPSMRGEILSVINEGDKITCEGYYKEEEGNKEVVWLKTKVNGRTGYTMKAFYSRR